MKKMHSKHFVTKKEGDEFFVELFTGDLFLSGHSQDGLCFAIYFNKKDLIQKNIEETYSKAHAYFGDLESKKLEFKFIGNSDALSFATKYFKNGKHIFIKKIEKNNSIEVLFLPLQNKVKVSKEMSKENPKEISKIVPVLKETNKFKILIVDDSKTIRNILAKIFSSDPMFEVCAMAERPSEVEDLIIKHRPDVITLDIHMPEMDGVTLLKKIAPKYNIPTIMISSISMAEGPLVLEALESGAIDYIQKPEVSEIESVTPLILEKVRTAAKANLCKTSNTRNAKSTQISQLSDLDSFVVIGSSTGGTEALREILTALPNQIPPMLIVQHIPAVFSAAFATRMNDLCPFEVKEAENGDEVTRNRVLIAPGGKQMKFIHKNGKSYVEINDDDPVNRFKPSVDYMFFSVAKSIFTHTVAVILTGMGKDGAKGMLELRKLGVRTIAQDEQSSVVFGMPKEAIAVGAVEFVEPLSQIAERITLLTKEKVSMKKVSNS